MLCCTFILFCSCGEVVTKREQFNDLSIDLPRRKKTLPLRSMQDSLDLFFRVSLLHKQVKEWKIDLGPHLLIFLLQITHPYKITLEYAVIGATFSLLQMEEIEYSCEKCNGKTATVMHKFSKLPRYLHRDDWEGNTHAPWEVITLIAKY